MPFFWVGGLGGGLLSTLIAGATLLTEAIPEPSSTLRFLVRERATLFRGWPEQAARIASHPEFATADLSELTAGSLEPVLPASLRSLPGSRANLFGMTETFGPYCGYPLDRDLPPERFGSCGQPFAGMQVRVVDPTTGQPLGAGGVGNIQVGGRNLLVGLCGREREEVFTSDGWYDTGDQGRLSDDGFLFFAGRKDDRVKIKGASVYPSEIESALQGVSGVNRVFATDIVINGTSAMGAAIVPDAPGALTLEHLAAEARQRLSSFKVPVRWLILGSMDEVPYTASGKIDKRTLQALLMGTHAENTP
jgi:acyl-CoA synthetase (AMP-forming)/AMP-acid ligase II